jgi:hypothetical protein
VYETYKRVIEDLKNYYGLRCNKEHDFIHEFYEIEDVPLFKLIFGYKPELEKTVVVITFHLDVTPVDSVQWYLRVYKVLPELRLQESYYKDDRGETFLGEKAEVLKYYKNEREILENWSRNQEDTREYLKNSKVFGRERDRTRSFLDIQDAMEEFNRFILPTDEELN